MTAPAAVTPLDPTSPQGIEVATRLAKTLGAIEHEISQRDAMAGDDLGAGGGGTHPSNPRPSQPPRPREEQQAA